MLNEKEACLFRFCTVNFSNTIDETNTFFLLNWFRRSSQDYVCSHSFFFPKLGKSVRRQTILIGGRNYVPQMRSEPKKIGKLRQNERERENATTSDKNQSELKSVSGISECFCPPGDLTWMVSNPSHIYFLSSVLESPTIDRSQSLPMPMK